MKVLIALTYYRPHVSGLTIYAERLAQALADRGHHVTVLTSRYDRALPPEEVRDGVHVVRVPVGLRISKGVLMPTFALVAARFARAHDVLSVHLPQLEAAILALLGRWLGKPVILTYHCDLRLPPGLSNRVADRVIPLANEMAAKLAHRIVSYTQDYVDHSPFLSRFRQKIVVIPPPIVIPEPSAQAVAAFRASHAPEGGPVVGLAARFATEKGVEFLVAAVPELLVRFPSLKVLFAGPYEDVIGEADYWQRLSPEIEDLDGHWQFLGTLSPAEMASFFGSCDLLVVPSLNSTESFGLVQVEAMLCGTPVVAADLPGVRQPVQMTGMGTIVPVGNAHALAAGVRQMLEHRHAYVRPRAEIEAVFDIRKTVRAYEELFQQEIEREGVRSRPSESLKP